VRRVPHAQAGPRPARRRFPFARLARGARRGAVHGTLLMDGRRSGAASPGARRGGTEARGEAGGSAGDFACHPECSEPTTEGRPTAVGNADRRSAVSIGGSTHRSRLIFGSLALKPSG